MNCNSIKASEAEEASKPLDVGELLEGQMSAAELDTKTTVLCTPSRCIDLFLLFRAVCYQVPEWIIDVITARAPIHTPSHCRSISPLMVISERAVLSAYWISSPVKEQQWHKKGAAGKSACVYVCLWNQYLWRLWRVRSRLSFIVAVIWSFYGVLFSVCVNSENYQLILLALFGFILQITWGS